MPYTDMLTVKEGNEKDEWGIPYMIFTHKAFRGGKLVFQEAKDTTQLALNSLGYAIKKGDSDLAQ